MSAQLLAMAERRLRGPRAAHSIRVRIATRQIDSCWAFGGAQGEGRAAGLSGGNGAACRGMRRLSGPRATAHGSGA
jgi:hypothetical protein